jgi:alkaline phosphatase D
MRCPLPPALLFLSLLTGPLAHALPLPRYSEERLERFAFASCNKQDRPQPLWQKILEDHPQFYLGLGDNIYGDSKNVEELAEKWEMQLGRPEYRNFRDQMRISGVWDDHDFGTNNSGGEQNPIREAAQKLLLGFFEEPADSPRWTREGIYTSFTYGPPGQEAKIILLDTRYFRDPPTKKCGDILGEAQWHWLESELTNSPARAHFIVTSFSMLSIKIPAAEQWRNFPCAMERLFKLLDRSRPSGVVFLTGDRHFAGVLDEPVHGRMYPEFMASGLTHGLVPPLTWIFRQIYGKTNATFKRNYGLIDIDWDRTPIELTFHARVGREKSAFSHRYQLKKGSWMRIGRTPVAPLPPG